MIRFVSRRVKLGRNGADPIFQTHFRPGRKIARMKELKLSLADRLASQAIRKAAAERLIEYGKRLREPGAPQIAEAELESELKAVRAERGSPN